VTDFSYSLFVRVYATVLHLYFPHRLHGAPVTGARLPGSYHCTTLSLYAGFYHIVAVNFTGDCDCLCNQRQAML
jgi:hypothetical protein